MSKQALYRLSLFISAFALTTLSAHAQTAPDAGALQREAERQPRQLPRPGPQAVPQAPAAAATDAVRVTVKAFRITGNTLISEPELQTVLAPWVGRELAFTELQQAANAVAEAYRKRGWFARPQLPAQDVSSGIISINILEGKLGAVRIDDGGKTLRVERDMVTDTMTARQKPGDPLNLDALERSSNILNDMPGVAVATILAPGKEAGESDAIVKVQDKSLIAGTVQADNTGSRSTGELKLSFSLTIDNPSGKGDQIAANANESQGSTYLKISYSIPVGSDGLRVGVNVSDLKYRLVGDDFQALKSKGDAQTIGVNASYPLLRSGTQNIALAGALDRKTYYNEANQLATSEKEVHALLVSVTGDLLDGFGNGGMTLWGSNITLGNVDLSAHATNQTTDRTGPRTAGSYHKIGANIARLQRLTDKATLWASFSGQVASKNLDSSEKFALGGPSGVRAYPVMEGTGDDGWLATLEARYNLLPELQINAFYDHGSIRRDHNGDYTGAQTPASGTLKGVGFGVSWSKPGVFSLRGTIANRLGSNPFRTLTAGPSFGKDTDGSYDKTRMWLTGTLFF
jgi:hemolysin activation/secretion protein